jgi:SAM-dependent methyltransferase
MPNLDWNHQMWTEESTWTTAGEEWSDAWGNSEAQWFGSLYPRLHRLLPARRILEIAPGFGRWTRFLLPQCENYTGIDLSPTSIKACRETFAHYSHAAFHQNDGLSLQAISDQSFDLIFSFDSLVHCEMEVLASYVPQIIDRLTPNGLAFIHHSNLFEVTGGEQETPSPHHRASSVSAQKVADLIKDGHGAVLLQEKINWGSLTLDDCITIFGKSSAFGHSENVVIQNQQFMGEATLIKQFQFPYSIHLSRCLGRVASE